MRASRVELVLGNVLLNSGFVGGVDLAEVDLRLGEMLEGGAADRA
jgi:hypothetical protein